MRNKKRPLARAVALVLAGTSVYAASASVAWASTTMYGTMNRSAPYTAPTPTNGGNGTDGWTRTGYASGTGSIIPWYGTAGTTAQPVLPFGFAGSQALNWAAHITNQGDALTISQLEANQRFGTGIGAPAFYPDLDTARGAWNDGGPPPNEVVPNTGWAHNTDYGLFKSDVTTRVTLTPTAIVPSGETWSNFAFTIFTGMDTGTGYSHHGGWNVDYDSGSPAGEASARIDNPMGTTGLTYLTHSDSGDVSWVAQAGQVYSIYLGGFDGLDNWGPHAGYAIDITTAPVPVPAAVWLFGSALAGMGVIGRRKERAKA